MIDWSLVNCTASILTDPRVSSSANTTNETPIIKKNSDIGYNILEDYFKNSA